MLILLYIGTILYAFVGKKQKFFWIWCSLLFVLITNTSIGYADFDGYELYYNSVTSGVMDINYMGMSKGWYYLCLFFSKVGLSYRGMTAVLIVVSCYLINLFLKKTKCNQKIFWGLFVIFPGIIQLVQLRFFFGTSIVFFGLFFILDLRKDGIKSTIMGLIKFTICVLLAYYIHSSCIIFIMYVFVPLFDRIGQKKTIFIFIISSLLLSTFVPRLTSIIEIFVSQEKFTRYFESSISETTLTWFMQILFVWIFCLIVCYYCNKEYRITMLKVENKSVIFTEAFGIRILTCVSLLCFTLPFLSFDRNFHRFLEIGYMLVYVYISVIWHNSKIELKNKYILLSIFVGIILIITYIYTPYLTVIKPFFEFSGFHSLIR